MSADIIADTAIRFGVSARTIFVRAAKNKGWSNWEEVAAHRFLRYVTQGEIPAWVSDHCLVLWNQSISHAAHIVEGEFIHAPAN